MNIPPNIIPPSVQALVQNSVQDLASGAANPVIVRFAPSPTGFLHLGNVFSALFTCAHVLGDGGLGDGAEHSGRFILRIEDIDTTRCRPEYEQAIYDDLHWLGLNWEEPVRRQSDHFDVYAGYIDALARRGLVYPCFCTRKDIAQAQNDLRAQGHAAMIGPDGATYPQTCRSLNPADAQNRIARGDAYALRLHVDAALAAVQGIDLGWTDLAQGRQNPLPHIFGDVVLARKDCPTSYHASVVIDDALQGVTLVTRGIDLFMASHLHRLLQTLWGFDAPLYHHHPLLIDPDAKTHPVMSKRHGALCVHELRGAGKTAPQVLKMVADMGRINDPAAKQLSQSSMDDAQIEG